MNRTAIAFGSNLGDSATICRDAIEILRTHPGLAVLAVSSLYETAPVGPSAGNWFINGVILCETLLEPEALLDAALAIEHRFGRVREHRWGPRTLDLDILFYGERQISTPALKIPHPHLQERLFVLVPLVEVAPGWVHPQLGLTARQLLERLAASAHGQDVRLARTQ